MADVSPMSVIQGLPRMRWRGLTAPEYDVASFDWDTGQAKRRYPGIDGAGHASVGRDAFPLTFRLYFLNSLTADAFPMLWDEWWPKLRDGEAGEMVHPLLGPVVAKALGGTVNVEARTTAGVIVDVRFEEHLEDPNEAIELETTQVSVRAAAEAAKAAMDAQDIPWPDGAPATDILDAIDMVESALYSATLTLEGFANQILGEIEGIISLTEALQDHENHPVTDALKTLYVGLYDMAAQGDAAAARATSTATAQHATTIDGIARRHSNTVAEIMTLNSGLLGSPVVDAGTTYRFYV